VTEAANADESAKPPEPAAPNIGMPGAIAVVAGAEIPGG